MEYLLSGVKRVSGTSAGDDSYACCFLMLFRRSLLRLTFKDIGGIERATRNPSLTSIVTLAKALEISPKDLIPNSSLA